MTEKIKNILRKASRSEIPKGITPIASTLTQEAFDNTLWHFEIKWDGFRMLSYTQGLNADLRSRNNSSFNKRFPGIKDEFEKMNINAVFDGEVVVLNENGVSDFNKILYRKDESGEGVLVYYVFDLLWYNGYNLMNLSLCDRRKLLKFILPKSNLIKYSDHIAAQGTALFELAKQMKLEGIVAKNKNSVYSPGIRSTDWLKIKVTTSRQAIVAGYLLDKDKHGSGFQSLIIGVKDKKELKYIGQVEAGVPRELIKNLLNDKKLLAKKSPFSKDPHVNRGGPFRTPIKNAKIVWIKPVKCEVKYLELTNDGLMRHPSFKELKNAI